jgi:alkylhydroperoxidase family enzyme
MATTHPAQPALQLREPDPSAPFLAPIEKPKGLLLKLLYRFTRRQFGLVPSWLSIWSARMPLGYTTWAGKVGKLNKKLTLPQDTVALVRLRVDSLNACGWCLDAGIWQLTKDSPHLLPKLNALPDYRSSPVFDAKERAALDYATELTETKHVSPGTFAELARHYSEREICELVWVVSTSHLYNINNHGLNIGSDGFCDIRSSQHPTTAPAA